MHYIMLKCLSFRLRLRQLVNRASMKMKHGRINPIIEKMAAAVRKRQAEA